MPAQTPWGATNAAEYTTEHTAAGNAVIRMAGLLAEMPWPDAAKRDDVRQLTLVRMTLEKAADEIEKLLTHGGN